MAATGSPQPQEACVDVRIGVIHTVKEIDVELPADADRDAVKASIDDGARRRRQHAVADRPPGPRGRACPAAKIAYVELGSPDDERRIGFGAS